MQLFGGQKPLCWWAKCMAVWRFPPPSRTRSLYISLSTHTNFSGPWHVQAGLNAQGALFFSHLPASLNTLGGWLRMGGILCSTHCVMVACYTRCL